MANAAVTNQEERTLAGGHHLPMKTPVMARQAAVSNQEEPQQQELRAGQAPDRTPDIQRLRAGQILHDTELPHKRTSLAPVARGMFGMPVAISNLPRKKAGARTRGVNRRRESQQSVASTQPEPSPIPASASMALPASIPALGSSSMGTQQTPPVQAQGLVAAQGGSGNASGHAKGENTGKLTVISAEQLEELRADLVGSAKENSDLRHGVEMLERKLSQTEKERQTYWECGMEWARREKALYMEMEYWKVQARAATRNNVGHNGGAVQDHFVGGPDSGVFGAGSGTGLGPAEMGACPNGHSAEADGLEKERNVMWRVD